MELPYVWNRSTKDYRNYWHRARPRLRLDVATYAGSTRSRDPDRAGESYLLEPRPVSNRCPVYYKGNAWAR